MSNWTHDPLASCEDLVLGEWRGEVVGDVEPPAEPVACRNEPVEWDGGDPPVACHDRDGAQIFGIHALSATLLGSGYVSTPAGWGIPSGGYSACEDL